MEYVFQPPPEPAEQRFVETNPDVPENKPDETRNFAARDQQSAQETPAEELSPDNSPTTEGEEPDSQKIVQGDIMARSAPPPVPPGQPLNASPSTPQASSAAPPPSVQMPEKPMEMPLPAPPPSAPDFLDQEPEETLSDDGMGSYLDPGKAEEEVEDPKEREKTINMTLNPMVTVEEPRPQQTPQRPQPQIQPNPAETQEQQQAQEQPESPVVVQGDQPRPRPRLAPRLPAGPLKQNPRGVTRVGAISIDANFSEFGDYLQRMFEAISYRWILLAGQTGRTTAEMDSRVVLRFDLQRDGHVESLNINFTSAGQTSTLICEDAVRSTAPYDPWTDEMIQTLGEQQTITITFIYR